MPAMQMSQLDTLGAAPADAGRSRWKLLVQHERFPLACALAGVALWWALSCALHPGVIVDELDHFAVIRELREGTSPLAREMPMPLTYHWLARAVLWPWEPPLWGVRALSALLSSGGLFIFDAAARRENARRPAPAGEAGPSLWHWAFLPLLFPYSALVYTEPLALTAVAVALYGRARGQAWLAAAAMLGSCLVRQSHVVWLAFFCLWELVEAWPRLGRGMARWLGLVRAGLPYGLAAAVMIALFVSRGSLSFSNLPNNDAGFNPGQFCVLGAFVLLLWAPVWVARGPLAAAACAAAVRARPLTSGLGLAVGVPLAAWGGLRFANLNEWNWLPEFVGNWLLIWMDRHAALATAIILADAAALGLLLWLGRPQQARLLLGALLFFTLIYLAPQNLIDPRYFVVPVALAHWLVRLSAAESRLLGVWYGGLSVAMAVVVLLGGMW